MLLTIATTMGGVLLTGLCGAVGWLVRRILANANEVDSLQRALDAVRASAERPETDEAAKLMLAQLELRCEQRYMPRDAYVPQMALMASKLDSLAECMGRIDERLRHQEAAP